MTESPLLTLAQVAKYLAVSTRTVQRLIDRGELSGVKVGNRWRFKPQDVEAYLGSNRQGETTEGPQV